MCFCIKTVTNHFVVSPFPMFILLWKNRIVKQILWILWVSGCQKERPHDIQMGCGLFVLRMRVLWIIFLMDELKSLFPLEIAIFVIKKILKWELDVNYCILGAESEALQVFEVVFCHLMLFFEGFAWKVVIDVCLKLFNI